MRFVNMTFWLAALPVVAYAHHSPNLHFDSEDFVEISGVLTEVKWQNPHIQLTILARDEDGGEVWQAEETNINIQIRRGVSEDDYQVGADIRVAGFRGLRNRLAIFATNTLLADGRELVSGQSPSGPLWSEDLVMSGADSQASKLEDASEASSSGLYRVWDRDRDAPSSSPGRQLWNDSYPLTEEARVTQAAWDPVADNPYLYCQNGMPAIMDSPHPLEIVRDGSDILIRLEEQDVVRRVSMGPDPTDGVPSPYGRSVGRWENETLVVTTTDINWPWFDQSGVPQSEELRLIERFYVSDDDRYLHYSVTAIDPTVFTEPVVLERRWIGVPGETVEPYNCIWERDDL